MNHRHILPLVISAIILSACQKPAPPPPPRKPVVMVTEAKQEEVDIYKTLIATVDGSQNTDVKAQVSGYLLTIAYKEGAPVKKGDLLFSIDPRPFQTSVDKAKADLASAQAQSDKAAIDEARNRKLLQDQVVSRSEYDAALQANKTGVASVQAAQAALDQAVLNLSFTNVIAPISGMAGKALPSKGDLLTASQTLTTISDTDPMRAQFSVDEKVALQKAEVINAYLQRPLADRVPLFELILPNGQTYGRKGVMDYIDRQVQSSMGTVTVYALFPNPDNILRPGQSVKVRSVTRKIEGAVVVPQRAVFETQGMMQLYVVDAAGLAQLRQVQLGETFGRLQVITKGLDPGEQVIVEGFQKCRPGTPVETQPFAFPPLPAGDEASSN